jgi:hypothetical protein
MTHSVAARPTSYDTIYLPSPGARRTKVKLPIYEETGFRVFERFDKLTGKHWTFAVLTELWVNPDPHPPIGATTSTLRRSTWMREGPRPDLILQEEVETGRQGWFSATHENIARISYAWRQQIREGHKRRNLAKQRGIHLLTCSVCGELSDLEARSWRLSLGTDGTTTTTCPRCEA